MDAAIVDLVALGTAATPLADWWEQFCATGHADVAALDAARKQLATMAGLPGRVGQAIRLVVHAPADVPPVVLTMAIEQVAATARRCPRARPPRRRRRPPAGAAPPAPAQLPLPGLDPDRGWTPGPVPPSA